MAAQALPDSLRKRIEHIKINMTPPTEAVESHVLV